MLSEDAATALYSHDEKTAK